MGLISTTTQCYALASGDNSIYFFLILGAGSYDKTLVGKVSLNGNKEWVRTITSLDILHVCDAIYTSDNRLLALGQMRLQLSVF